MELLEVRAGKVETQEWGGETLKTAIVKNPVEGKVMATQTGLNGGEIRSALSAG